MCAVYGLRLGKSRVTRRQRPYSRKSSSPGDVKSGSPSSALAIIDDGSAANSNESSAPFWASCRVRLSAESQEEASRREAQQESWDRQSDMHTH